MIQNIMHRMEGISLFGVFSICLFFAFFSAMLIWAAWLKRDYLKSMSELPLDGGEASSSNRPAHNPSHVSPHE